MPEENWDLLRGLPEHIKRVPPTPGLHIEIASPPDREQAVCEVWDSGEQFAEINQEHGQLTLEIYPRREGQPWVFPFDDLLTVLERARGRLIGREP